MADVDVSTMTGVDAIRAWGTVCSKASNCENCPMQAVAGVGVPCQQFAAQFPEKFLSNILAIVNEGITYYDEYCIRFPESDKTLEDVASSFCRKDMFENYEMCLQRIPLTGDEEKDKSIMAHNLEICKSCWLQQYEGDATVTEDEIQRDYKAITGEELVEDDSESTPSSTSDDDDDTLGFLNL